MMHGLRSLRLPALMLAFVALGAYACAPAEEPVEEEPMVEETVPAPEPVVAVAALMDTEGNEVGTATFTEHDGATTAVFEVSSPGATGMHGIHVHETGDCSAADFTSAGGHFNPAGVDHACPDTSPRHAGDFGNIDLGEDGTGHHEVTTDLVTVEAGPNSVTGKAVILHAGEDDCTSQPTGDAGSRLACGVIESPMGMDDEMGHDMGHDMDHDEIDAAAGQDQGEDV